MSALFAVALAGCAAGSPAAAGSGGDVDAAHRLLKELVLPAGSAPLSPGALLPTGFQSDQLGCPGMVERTEYLHVPGLSIGAAQAWFQQHAPSGTRVTDVGSGGDRTGETMTDVAYVVDSGQVVPAGSRLVVESVPDGSGSVIRVSAQVVPATGCGSAPQFGSPHG